jgi:hypothetical protein
MKPKYNAKFVGSRVRFLNPKHGFWQIGTCYKETAKRAHVKDVLDKRYIVFIGDVELYVEES